MTDWLQWEVEPFYGVGSGKPFERGRVVAYSDAPQVLVETPDGEKHWWRADLVRRIRRDHAARLEAVGSETCMDCGGDIWEHDTFTAPVESKP